MYIQQLYTNCLAQAAYYIENNGQAAIIDPMRDVDEYINLLHNRGAKLKYIFETHFHADFVSGHIDLAKKTGAKIIFGPGAKPSYEADIAGDGDTLFLGECQIKILHTPGHTIESICCLLMDENEKPYALFSGDTLFVGDVGRPDLLSGNLSAAELASQLYDSLNNKIKNLPDDVIVYPGHGPGSACGRSLGQELQSTIGMQKQLNYALQPMDRKDFIEAVTADQPAPPPYFFKDAAINKYGYEPLEKVTKKAHRKLSTNDINEQLKKDITILDVRTETEYTNLHIKGSIHIGLNGSYAVWVGTLIDINQPIIIVCEKNTDKEAITRLGRIGYENIIGYYDDDIIHLTEIGKELCGLKCIEAKKLLPELSNEKNIVLDVRTVNEYNTSKIPNSLNIPLNELLSNLHKLNKTDSYLINCAGGYRSLIAASLMEKNGFTSITNVNGGMSAIEKEAAEILYSSVS
ncbi:MAG: MBL fold metallo-hydrolase [Bacteroidota bacterium]|nr:MBL fold metallo-hydrolase [Bacteroidota bacterium]